MLLLVPKDGYPAFSAIWIAVLLLHGKYAHGRDRTAAFILYLVKFSSEISSYTFMRLRSSNSSLYATSHVGESLFDLSNALERVCWTGVLKVGCGDMKGGNSW